MRPTGADVLRRVLPAIMALAVALIVIVGSVNLAEAQEQEVLPLPRTEWSAFPAVGRNTDQGFLFGLIFMMAQYEEDYDPYQWRCLSTLDFSLKETPDGVTSPWQLASTAWDLPNLGDGRLRLYMEAAYSATQNEGYFGQGNDSGLLPLQPDAFDPNRRHQFGIVEPRIRVNARYILTPEIDLWFGAYVRYIDITAYKDSRLSMDIAAQAEGGRGELLGMDPHANVQFAAGLTWDTRNHETAPSSGWFQELSVRGAVGAPFDSDIAFFGVTLSFRGYIPIYHDTIVLAGRLLTDDVFGNVPFYELIRGGAFETISLLGGSNGIRGIPVGRYAGRLRVLGNLELRAMFLRFNVGEHRFKFGTVAFTDAGRIWTGAQSGDALDGSGLGIHYSIGGGLRLHWGESTMIRADVAYAPEAQDLYPNWPVLLYMLFEHAF